MVSTFTPKRGRPDAKQVAAIEAAILATAQRLFLADGFDAVGMEIVAAETGVSKGTLYSRYPSKEDLFHAVVVAAVQRWSAEAAGEDDQLTGSIAQRLRHHARVVARSLLHPEIVAFRRLLLAQPDRFSTLARALYEHGHVYIRNLLTDEIARAATDEEPVRDARGVAERLLAAINGWHLQETLVRDVDEAELLAFADRTVSLLIAARAQW